MEEVKASVPQPPPKKKGVVIPTALIGWLRDNEEISEEERKEAIKLVKERDLFGRNKYGQSLMSEDGRDTCEDVLQELGDMLQYAYKAKINGENIDRVKRLMPVLNSLMRHIK